MAAAHLSWPGMRVNIKCVASLSRQERGRVLAAAGPERGAPVYFRNDNGPEFIAKAVREWNAGRGLQTIYVETGTRWQKACSECFKSRLRDQLFNRENFARLSEAKVLGGTITAATMNSGLSRRWTTGRQWSSRSASNQQPTLRSDSRRGAQIPQTSQTPKSSRKI
jgi:hypothetical protein